MIRKAKEKYPNDANVLFALKYHIASVINAIDYTLQTCKGNMNVKKIYFDLDGVLADFEGGVQSLCNMTPTPLNGERDIKYDDLMWQEIKKVEHFYKKLKPMPGAKQLFDTVYSKYGASCEILTAIPKPKRGIAYAAQDKVEWVRQNISKDVKVNAVMREEKQEFCIDSGCVLIDDMKKNTENWQKLGGTGILHTDSETTLDILKEYGII